MPSVRAFGSAGGPSNFSNLKSSKKHIATIDLAGAVSFKSSGFLFNMVDGERFGGTTKASNNGWNMQTSGASLYMLKDSALTPGSLFRGTFMNNYESTGVLKRAQLSKTRRQSTGKIPPKNVLSLLKNTKVDLTESPPLRKIEVPINPDRGGRLLDLKRETSTASILSRP